MKRRPSSRPRRSRVQSRIAAHGANGKVIVLANAIAATRENFGPRECESMPGLTSSGGDFGFFTTLGAK